MGSYGQRQLKYKGEGTAPLYTQKLSVKSAKLNTHVLAAFMDEKTIGET